MELKNLFGIFKRNWLWLMVPLILVLIATIIFTNLQKPQPTANFSLTFVPANQNQSSSATNDLQLANLLATTAQSWLNNPALVSQILTSANVDPSTYSDAALTKLFTISLSPNSFELGAQIPGTSTEQATDLANSAINLVTTQTKQFNQNSGNGVQFAIQASAPYISQEKSSLKINLLLGALAGLALGLILILGKHYVES
jgi:capsular polysaccharide biosynthesis protein